MGKILKGSSTYVGIKFSLDYNSFDTYETYSKAVVLCVMLVFGRIFRPVIINVREKLIISN